MPNEDLLIKVKMDINDFKKSQNDLRRDVDKLEKDFRNSYAKVDDSIEKVNQETKDLARNTRDANKGSKLSIGSLAKAWIAYKAVVASVRAVVNFSKFAADAEEAANKFNTVFGEASDEVTEKLTLFANAANRSIFQLKEGASTFQNFFEGLGVANDRAAQFAVNLTKLASDFSSFNNIADSEAIQKFLSALSGSSEVLRPYGIDLAEATVAQKALLETNKENVAALTQMDKAIARLKIIEEVLSKQGAMGDAIRTSESFTNQMRGLSANIETVKNGFGGLVITLLESVIPSFNKSIEVLARYSESLAELRNIQKDIKQDKIEAREIIQVGKINEDIKELARQTNTLNDYMELLRDNVKDRDAYRNFVTSINDANDAIRIAGDSALFMPRGMDALRSAFENSAGSIEEVRSLLMRMNQPAKETAEVINDVAAEMIKLEGLNIGALENQADDAEKAWAEVRGELLDQEEILEKRIELVERGAWAEQSANDETISSLEKYIQKVNELNISQSEREGIITETTNKIRELETENDRIAERMLSVVDELSAKLEKLRSESVTISFIPTDTPSVGLDSDALLDQLSSVVSKAQEAGQILADTMQESADQALSPWMTAFNKMEERWRNLPEIAKETMGMTSDQIEEHIKERLEQEDRRNMGLHQRRVEFLRNQVESERESAEAQQFLWERSATDRLKIVGGILGQLSILMTSEHRKQFEIGKAAAAAQATIDTWAAAQSAYKAFAWNPPLATAAAASAVAAGLFRVKQITDTSMGSSGSGSAAAGGGGGGGNISPAAGGGGNEQSVSRVSNINVALQGERFDANQVRSLINMINEQQADGVEVRTTVN